MDALSVARPRYVLLDAQGRIGPPLSERPSGPEYVVIYGFSDREPYDLFHANSQRPLKPYPLVKGFLQNQIAEPGSTIHLIAVDAAGPHEAQFNAVTMSAVLEAQEKQTDKVAASFRLILDPETEAYRVEEVSSSVDPPIRQPTETQGKRDADELESV